MPYFEVGDGWCAVIPGRAEARTRNRELSSSGFRVHRCAMPRNDGEGESRRTDPVAMKSIGNPMPELHQGDGAGLDVGGVEYREIAAVFAAAPNRGQQPAVALGGIVAAGDEHRLGDGVAGGQQILAEARSLAIDMHHTRQRAEHRQLRIGAGVPTVVAYETGAAVVDAREFAGDVVEIGLRE